MTESVTDAERQLHQRLSGPMEAIRAPHDLADVDVGVVRDVFGVAGTGSVWISDAQFEANALGFLPQQLIVLLDPNTIVANMHRAYGHRGISKAKYSVFMTGPSATADIEGVLIHGAQRHSNADGDSGIGSRAWLGALTRVRDNGSLPIEALR